MPRSLQTASNSRVSATAARLHSYATEAKPPVIRVRGDGKVAYEKVAEIFGEVERAGLTRFTIDSQAK